MGARQKLNTSYFTGSLLVAGLAGGLTDSCAVFGLALILLVGLSLWTREIRTNKPKV